MLRELEEQGLSVVRLEEMERESTLSVLGGARAEQVLEITRALNALLRVGLSVPAALNEATGFLQADGRAVLKSLSAHVDEGERLADAMAHHPAWFDAFVVGTVRSGEGSGNLSGAFERLERKLERDAELRAELFSALIYPTLLAIVGGAAVCVLLAYVVPRFAEVLSASGGELPGTTRLVLTVSGLVQSWWWIALVGAGVVGIALGATTEPSARARVKALFLLRCPGVSSLRRQALTARYARMLSVLLGGGAPLSEGLRYCEDALGDPLARSDAGLVRSRVSEGASLGAALSESRVFDPTFARLVAAGEACGRLGDFVERAADFYERRLERAARRAVALVEPVMIVAFGVVVGFVALAVVQAIYGINAQSW